MLRRRMTRLPLHQIYGRSLSPRSAMKKLETEHRQLGASCRHPATSSSAGLEQPSV
jgi:hypothetical protein